MTPGAIDTHSYANPLAIRVRHLDLDLEVSFAERLLRGTVDLTLDRVRPDVDTLVVDTRALVIHDVELDPAGDSLVAEHSLGEPHPILGTPLVIKIRPETAMVRVRYQTSARATALQWLTPPQTAGKRHPFLFTQSQAIHARSWIPLQDSPGVRVTYSARIKTPSPLRALMSAAHESDDDPSTSGPDVYRFRMSHPVPSYLIALAVGELEFEPISARAGVYAEPALLSTAAREFEDTEQMIAATERVYGDYRWGRYDLLVLPPSFPFGGMENPRLTFATPTVLAGDKSLVSLVAHELAHSWSGNLVTNATWRDFWLNEGFTTYLERRIVEEVFGRSRADMESVLGRRTLATDLERLADPDTRLHLDLDGRDPDDGMNHVPYEKGALFVLRLEQAVGRQAFDTFLRSYFDAFAFQSITTGDFESYLSQQLGATLRAAQVDVHTWVHEPGLPADTPRLDSTRLARVATHADEWVGGRRPASGLPMEQWTTHEWLHFLSSLPSDLSSDQLAELDAAGGLGATENAEVGHAWLRVATECGYPPADHQLERYLNRIGRRKLIQPLYEVLAATPAGLARARSIYQRARSGYHPITVDTIDRILGFSESPA